MEYIFGVVIIFGLAAIGMNTYAIIKERLRWRRMNKAIRLFSLRLQQIGKTAEATAEQMKKLTETLKVLNG